VAPRGSDSTELRESAWKSAALGIELCRRGLWKGGITQLRLLEANKSDGQAIPGLALSYFGYGIASVEGRIQEGVRYCRAAVDREIWRAENHLNLARTYLLAGRVKPAVEALDYGLGLEPTHPAILDLRIRLGVRKRPTFPFLDRSHPLNRIAGRIRHRWWVSRRVSVTIEAAPESDRPLA
jgi:tetratricopeptide (TPR) repeat protein